MTKITLYRTDDVWMGFRALGHAGYAEQGEDIVCAGISILTINCVNSIERFTEDFFTLNTDEETGLIDFQFSRKPSEKSQLLMDSLVLGLEDLEREHNSFLLLDYKEV